MTSYLLPPYVHVCRADDHVVMLDLRRSKYLAIGQRLGQVLGTLVLGWPTELVSCTEATHAEALPEKCRSAVNDMVHQGLLTQDSTLGKTASPLTLVPAAASLVGEDADVDVRIDARRIATFLSSVAVAGANLRWGKFERVVRSVQARKARHCERTAFDFDAARDAMAAFERLRPLGFSSRDKCLFHSLALIEFLAHERIFPMWIIGVKTGPFGAHSWVQQGNVVFNDLPEQVRRFTPILAV